MHLLRCAVDFGLLCRQIGCFFRIRRTLDLILLLSRVTPPYPVPVPTMNDIELQSMTDFQDFTSADAAAMLLEKILESSLATFPSHEDTDESDSNDEEVVAVIVPPTKLYLQRQLVYSRKYVKKKEVGAIFDFSQTLIF